MPTTDPHLDIAALRALREPPRSTPHLRARIRAHLDAHDGYVAFSGGKDSLVTLHLALQVEPNVPVVFFDSGFEFPETYNYLEQVQNELLLQLHWIQARQTTLQVLAATGAWDHTATRAMVHPDLHKILITEPSEHAHAEHGQGELWGVRAQESRGRAALYANALRAETALKCKGCSHGDDGRLSTTRRTCHGGVVRRTNGTVAFGPIWNWKNADVWAHIAVHQLPINPVYLKLHRLGAPEHFLRVSHLLDAARLEEGRATWLRRGWPDLFEDLAEVLPRLREFI